MLARRKSTGAVQVLLPDDTTATLPEWMFDVAYCQAIVRQESPHLPVGTLRDLRRWVDSGLLACDANTPIASKDNPDEATSPSGGTALDQRQRAGGAACAGQDGVPPTAQPAAARSPERGKGGGR